MVPRRSCPVVFATVVVVLGAQARAQDRIRDNLFLLEEAYNQEPGVIQHISVFQSLPRTREWWYSFTDEWPVPTDFHQLSVTLNVIGLPAGASASFGDLLVNWRMQALGLGGTGAVAMAPRLSLVLPTGSVEKGTGRGAIGVQVALPVSIEMGGFLVAHLNAGLTITPSAHGPGGRTETALDAGGGIAVVAQPVSWLNPLVEVVYLNEEVLTTGGSRRAGSLVVNPGLRLAIDVPGTGLQVVPGVGAPIRVWPEGKREVGVVAYLSFEHPAFTAGRQAAGDGWVGQTGGEGP